MDSDLVERVALRDGAWLWTVSRIRPDTEPVVFVHGGPGLWDYLAPAAALLGTTSHRYDQRGCGRSSAQAGTSHYRLERFVADLEELRQHFGHERWTVFGHSFGAELGLAYALAHPDRVGALIHCSGTGPNWPAHRDAYRSRARERLSDAQAAELAALEDRVRTWAEEVRWRTLNWVPDFADPTTAEGLALAAARVELPVNVACNEALNAEVVPWAPGAWDSLDVPVLVLHGSADPRPVEGVRELLGLLPHAELRVLDGAGHHPWVERPGEFAAAVGEFLTARTTHRPTRSSDR